LIIGCADPVKENDDGGQDQVITDCPEGLALCVNSELGTQVCTNPQFDALNCGACGNICSNATSPDCFSGVCSCAEKGPCESQANCIRGNCSLPDTTGKFCEDNGDCEKNEFCISGHCTLVLPEVCDGLDNDHDGEIDEPKETLLDCYSGPLGTESVLPCRPGYRVCENGLYSDCLNEIVPIPELGPLSCDVLDNDCDGCIDGLKFLNECQPYNYIDVVFIVDVSGSMTVHIQDVEQALANFVEFHATTPGLRFALIVFPWPAAGTLPAVKQDLTDYQGFLPALTYLYTDNGGFEPSWDVLPMLENGALTLLWTSEAKRLFFMFTDEEGWSGRNPANTEILMCAALPGEAIQAVFSVAPYLLDFDLCSTVFYLDQAASMLADMKNTLNMICGN